MVGINIISPEIPNPGYDRDQLSYHRRGGGENEEVLKILYIFTLVLNV